MNFVSLTFVVIFFIGIIALIISYLKLSSGRARTVLMTFFLAFALRALLEFLVLAYHHSSDLALIIVKFSYLLRIIAPASFAVFVMLVVGAGNKAIRWTIAGNIVAVIVFAILEFSNLVQLDIKFTSDWGYFIEHNLVYNVLSAILFANFAVILWSVYKYYERRKSLNAKLVTCIFFALLIYPTGIIVNELLTIFWGIRVFLITSVSFVISVYFMVCAVFRGGLLSESIIKLKKLKTKIVVPIIVFVVIILSFVSIMIYIFFHGVLEKEMENSFKVAINSRARQIEEFFVDKKEQVVILSRDHHFSDMLLEESGRVEVSGEILEDKATHYNEVANIFKRGSFLKIFVMDTNGKVILSTDSIDVGQDFSQEHYFKEGLNAPFVDPDHYFRVNEKLTFAFSAPIKIEKDFSEEKLGVLVILVDSSGLDEMILDKTGLGESGRALVIDANFNVVSPSVGIEEKDFSNDEFVKRCFAERSDVPSNLMQGRINSKGEKVLSIYRHISEPGWCLLFEVNENEAFVLVNQLLQFISVAGALALIVSYVMVNSISKRITGPIEELQRGVEIIEAGDLNYKVGTDSQDEIGSLSREFDEMTEAILKSKEEVEERVQIQTQDIVKQKEKLELQQRAILNILEDVKSEKDKSSELVQELEKFKMAVDNSSDHIVITDVEGIVIYANKSVENITGFSINEIIGKKAGTKDNWGGLMEKSFYEEMWDTIKNKKSVYFGEMRNKRRSGEEYDAKVSAFPILNKNKDILFFVGIERDITREKEVDRAKTEFVSLASHQLRTPLSAISWYAEMLLDGDAGKVTKKQKQYLDEIYRGNRRMIDLVNSLLSVSRIELGTFSIEPEPSKITEILDEALVDLDIQINEKKIKLMRDYDGPIPKLNLDPRLMGVVFQNILSNSIKYTPDSGVICISLIRRKDDVLVAIADTGYGIPRDQYDEVFGKLFRADNVREKDTTGTGLGLYIVKAIVDKSGGKIWFNSTENIGTVFYISIPKTGMKRVVGKKGLLVS